jgi:TonB family protein
MIRSPDLLDHQGNAKQELSVSTGVVVARRYGEDDMMRGTVPAQSVKQGFAVGLLLLSGWVATGAAVVWGQEQTHRTVKVRVQPVYPDLARRMNIRGVVKLQVSVAANGSVKNVKLVGGHPVLADAASNAVRQWRFETGPQESTENVEIRFDPVQ